MTSNRTAPSSRSARASNQTSVADGVSVVMNKQDEGLFWKSTIIREQSNVKFPSRGEEKEHKYAGRTLGSPFQGWMLNFWHKPHFPRISCARISGSYPTLACFDTTFSWPVVMWSCKKYSSQTWSFEIFHTEITNKLERVKAALSCTFHTHAQKVQSMNRRIVCNKNNLQRGRQKILCLQNFWLDDINIKPLFDLVTI